MRIRPQCGRSSTCAWSSSTPTSSSILRSGIGLDFPARPAPKCEPPAGLLAALDANAVWVGSNSDDFLVEVATEAEVRTLRPDFPRLVGVDCRGIIVTARAAAAQADFVSR